MKTVYISIIALLSLISLCGCEEVIYVDLDTETPRLVVEAFLKWQKGTTGSNQFIRLSTTTDYYTNTIPPVKGAKVSVKNQNTGEVFEFAEDLTNKIGGIYICITFKPVIGNEYTLTIETNGQTYTATEKMISVVPIDKIVLDTENAGINMGGEDRSRYKVFFTDPADTKDVYWMKVLTDTDRNGVLTDDTFFNGNQFSIPYSFKKDQNGLSMDFALIGISPSYFSYINIIMSLAGGRGGSPFATPPATARGNIVNQTDKNNYGLGYFSLSEMDVKTITVVVQPPPK